MLSVAFGLSCEVIYFQDVTNCWYQGSQLLPPLADIITNYLKQKIGTRRAIFFGQSSGAYAALVAARYFEKSAAIVCAPQTFSDAVAKAGINFVKGVRPVTTPAGLIDIASLWEGVDVSERYIGAIISATESGNPIAGYFWMDHLHISRLININGIEIYIVPFDTHSFLHGRIKIFSSLLIDACKTENIHLHDLVLLRLNSMIE